MKKIIYLHIIVIVLFWSCNQERVSVNLQEQSLTSYVNTFIGTDGPGNTYPGATLPFGMVQLSPDIGIPGWDRIAGYYYKDSIISGFSHTHLTGTGAGDLYDILVMPTNSKFSKKIKENNYKPFSTYSHDKEFATPGYYTVDLLDYGIKAELTATNRVGIHRYTFPKDTATAIHVDLGYAINWDKPTDTYIEKVDEKTIQGYRMSTGWAKDQRIYFVMQFSKPFAAYKVFKDEEQVTLPIQGADTRIVLQYDTAQDEQIIIKAGISTASIEGALASLNKEASKNNFDYYKSKAQSIWERELQKIKITTADNDKKSIFYTMMYQSMLAPTLLSDPNGNYKGANGSVVNAKGFNRYDTFSLWDTFRAAHPLYTIIQQERVSDMIQSMLAHYKETGTLPVWSMQGNETNMMIGYHAVPVIVDAYFKDFQFDTELAYKACKESAMVDDRQIDIYKRLDYVPVEKHHENWSVSKTLEYAYDDWCIAMFAKDLGKNEDYTYFMKRSENWKNLYNDKNTWIQPKDTLGNFFEPFNPKEYTSYYCESNAWQYYWFVPQDIEGLIKSTGGKERFTQKLDSMFSYDPKPEDKLPIFSTGMIGQYAHGNEPSHHVAYLYNYVNQPSKTQKLTREILEGQYRNEPNGHCGNEDCGQMSSWYIFSSLGFYPVNPAQGAYHITAPIFEQTEIQLPEGKTFLITAKNLSEESTYIKSIRLNGKPLDRMYITHKEIINGGFLEFEMSNFPNDEVFKNSSLPEVNKIY
ncbi:putative alpha-1,2-mannosidase [Aquimarina sp. MAR_2010_214]|uniref:GH92 family glycosyl hydrolase n=1 Tax=Aquimarina sp. MAR_2010_214 TaxID=1250026 RepID=UPI000C6FF487|nr:GH92 family glycosyl hydrolase [Aquimarina sp. MAR_2010_214]PKV50157.1 putative alpha-1,2-mannosidase [Aquimarina sp. MAR_2010_214]